MVVVQSRRRRIRSRASWGCGLDHIAEYTRTCLNRPENTWFRGYKDDSYTDRQLRLTDAVYERHGLLQRPRDVQRCGAQLPPDKRAQQLEYIIVRVDLGAVRRRHVPVGTEIRFCVCVGAPHTQAGDTFGRHRCRCHPRVR